MVSKAIECHGLLEIGFIYFVGTYYCSICDLKFSFKSKLDRHLASAPHTFFANAIEQSCDMEDDSCTEEVRLMYETECSHQGEFYTF